MATDIVSLLDQLGVQKPYPAGAIGETWLTSSTATFEDRSPIDNQLLAEIPSVSPAQVDNAVTAAVSAHLYWRTIPAPRRGELVRRIGERLREQKEQLATLVTLEVGKIRQEALGEVQEMIDICEFAVGLSRQLYGLTIASERPGHRMMEQWHPLGPIGVITAFNFPVAVWAWNTALALVCGDSVIWKPSEKAPLCALACHAIAMSVLSEMDEFRESSGNDGTPLKGLLSVLIGDRDIGEQIVDAPQLPLISATGSVPMGRAVAQRVAARLGRSLLELGGNNGMIVAPTADIELAVRSIVFSAAGTCGQRCTTLRRLFVHESLYETLRDRLVNLFAKLPIGDPHNANTLVGPLIDCAASDAMQQALDIAKQQGGIVHGGEVVTSGVPTGGAFVRPALVEISHDAPIVEQETFAPILYLMRFTDFDSAIERHNNVPQGLSSAVITSDVREAEKFLSPAGSDCGIANVNIGTSGAEIGGAFGGEKETGGGRESGSDAWKQYMRRATNTINYSNELPLAQGISFDVS